MKLKQLESLLSEVAVFENPKIELEQVPTSAHIASRMIYTAANQYDDIENCFVGDFGCGTGMLSIASNALGSPYVVGFDIDESALETAWINCKAMEITDIDLVQTNIQHLSINNVNKGFDTVIMNPPFGTRHAGIDTTFVLKGMEYANVVYSLHKTSTRDHFERLAENHNFTFEVIAELKYDIPKTFKFHKEKSKDIYVDLLRFTHKE